MATPAPTPSTPVHHFNPVPPAIRRQAEEAERRLVAQGNPPEPAEGDGNSSSNPQPDPAPASAPAPQAPPHIEDQLRSTQGRLDAEREKTTRMGGEIASLQRMVAELQQAQRQAPPPEAQQPATRHVTEEEENDYGKELLDVVGKRAMDVVGPLVNSLNAEIASLKGQLAQVGHKAQEAVTNDITAELTRRIPGWRQQNEDPGFLGWLAQSEPWSGVRRQQLLLDAFNGQDIERVVRFFQGYLDEVSATRAAPQPAPAPVPGSPANGKVPLENFASPGKASPAAAAAPANGQKPIYAQSYITAFYTAKANGQWRGREAEAATLEADLFRAQHEGRVVAG